MLCFWQVLLLCWWCSLHVSKSLMSFCNFNLLNDGRRENCWIHIIKVPCSAWYLLQFGHNCKELLNTIWKEVRQENQDILSGLCCYLKCGKLWKDVIQLIIFCLREYIYRITVDIFTEQLKYITDLWHVQCIFLMTDVPDFNEDKRNQRFSEWKMIHRI